MAATSSQQREPKSITLKVEAFRKQHEVIFLKGLHYLELDGLWRLLFNYKIIFFRQIHHINHSSHDNHFCNIVTKKVFKRILNWMPTLKRQLWSHLAKFKIQIPFSVTPNLFQNYLILFMCHLHAPIISFKTC